MLKKTVDKIIYNLILDAADKKSDSTFFIYNGEHIKYSDAILIIQKMAAHLRKTGISKNDIVIIYLDNCPELIYSYFAVMQIGAISTLVNATCKLFELQSYIQVTKPKLIITSLRKKIHLISTDYHLFDQEKVIYIDGQQPINSFWRIVESEKPYTDCERLHSSDVASIIFSSAMDGFPLGVMLGHHGIYDISETLAGMADDDDVIMPMLPLSHSYGMVSSFLGPLHKQIPFKVIQDFPCESFDSFLKNDSVSIFITIPRIYEWLAKKILPRTSFPKIKHWISGGQSMSDQIVDDLINKFNIVIEQGYGLTEASSIVSWNHSKNQKKAKSAGKVMPWNKVKIVNNEGETLSNGQEGEIMLEGSNVMLGYYNNPQKTKESIINGLLKTGDIGRVDDEGFLYITGRKKKMIIKNGINVYPKEVERMLCYHPQINSAKVESKFSTDKKGNTRESLIATIYQKKSGQINRRDFISWCMKNMSLYKIPDQIIIK